MAKTWLISGYRAGFLVPGVPLCAFQNVIGIYLILLDAPGMQPGTAAYRPKRTFAIAGPQYEEPFQSINQRPAAI